MMGKFRYYFERASRTGLDESIRVPTFETKDRLKRWLNEVSKDKELDTVMANDDVYDPETEDVLIEKGDYLSELKKALGHDNDKEHEEIEPEKHPEAKNFKRYLARQKNEE